MNRSRIATVDLCKSCLHHFKIDVLSPKRHNAKDSAIPRGHSPYVHTPVTRSILLFSTHPARHLFAVLTVIAQEAFIAFGLASARSLLIKFTLPIESFMQGGFEELAAGSRGVVGPRLEFVT